MSISRSKQALLFAAALGASAAVHITLAGVAPKPVSALTGGDIADDVALGSGFANLVSGIKSGLQDVSDMTQQPTPDTLQPRRTENSKHAVEPEPTTTPPAPQTATRQPKATRSPPPSPAATSVQTRPTLTTQAPVAPVSTSSNAPADAVFSAPIIPVNKSKSVLQSDAAPTPQASADKSVPVTSEVEPQAPKPATSLRPKVRPATLVKRATIAQSETRPEQTLRPRPANQSPARQGNAKANVSRGQSDGSERARAAETTKATQTRAAQAGATSLKSYKSSVLRRVARTRGANAGARGTAIISMRIAVSGNLAGVSVARSSGNPHVDRAAMTTVQRSEPFGKPPNGKAITLNIRINVKG